MRYERDDVVQMLYQSNLIEREPSNEALIDALAAWDYLTKRHNPITLKTVLGVHQRLQRRLRPDIAGKWRDCDVWIGGEHKPFISTALIEGSVKSWIKLSNPVGMAKWSPERQEKASIESHITFEGLHPFEDGNGRVGRIFYNYLRLQLGLPIHIIEFEDRWEYYDWFKKDKNEGVDG